MSEIQPIGPVLHSFFADHLIMVKGTPARVGAQLSRHGPAFALLHRGRQGLQDHPALARRPDL